MMRPDSSDKQLISGASEFSRGQVPLNSFYGAPKLVIGGTRVLSDVGHKDLRRMEGG